MTDGDQQYVDNVNAPILTLSATKWFDLLQTWPSNIANYAYIDFYHFLDNALQAESIPGMGPEFLGDAAWTDLFSPGPLPENNDIKIYQDSDAISVFPQGTDQLGQDRPLGILGDIGAIETP